jgi:hypothetical protein
MAVNALGLDPQDPLIPLPWQMDSIRAYRASKALAAEEDALKMQKLRFEVEKMQEDKAKSQPDYEAKLAGDIAERTGKIQETLNLNQMQRAGIGQRLGDISSASAPLDIDVSGPVLPQQMAMQAGQGLVAEENLLNAQKTRMMAELEAYRKKQEGLVGSVNLGEAYGTAPAGSSADVMRRRVQEQSNMFREARDFVNSAQTPEEAQDRANSVSVNKAYFDAQTREELKNTRKLPGFEGLAKDEDAARKMRERVPTFVSTVSAIDRLIELGQLTEGMTLKNPVQLARYRAEADQIRIPLVAALRVPLLGGGQMTEQERAFVQSAIANPTDYLNFASIDRLKTLKRTVASEFSSATRNYGFQLKSLQSVIDANSAPGDINTFGVKSQAMPTEKPQSQPKPNAVYNPATGLLK